MTTTTKPTWPQRLSDAVLVVIVLAVGIMAGAASFSHVHDWTMTNSPAGTGDWFGWANAVITELIPTAALIVIARRRRNGGSIFYPMCLLVVAVGLSLTAQLAVAVPTVFGWMVSALPALAFFALSKLVFSSTRPTDQVQALEPATDAPAPSFPDTAPATVRPAATTTTTATITPPIAPSHEQPSATNEPATATPQPVPPSDTVEPSTVDPALSPASTVTAATRPVTSIAELLPRARHHARTHEHDAGEPISANQLAVRLQVPTALARDLLTSIYPNPTVNTGPHNGTEVGVTR